MKETVKTPKETLQELYQVLEEEIRQYEIVAEKLTHKRDILVSGKSTQLVQIDQELMALSRKATQLEKQREAIQAQMGFDQYPLSKLIQELPAPVVPTFQKCRERLLIAAKTVQKLNQDNQDLLTLSLQWIQETVEIIAKAIAPEGAAYSATGHKKAPKKQGATVPAFQSTISRSI